MTAITYTVRYQIATYSGAVLVTVDENADNDEIIAKAKAQVLRDAGGFLPYGYESWEIEQ